MGCQASSLPEKVHYLPYIGIASLAVMFFFAARPQMLPVWLHPVAGIVTSKASWAWRRTVTALAALCLLGVGVIGLAVLQAWIDYKRPTHYASGPDFPLCDLPPSAHDIRMIPRLPFAPWGLSYEFRCTESDFLAWLETARVNHPELSPLREEINYYLPLIAPDGSYEDEAVARVLLSDWTFEDQGLYYAYERASGRAVTWSHSR